ncbi:hypothetical protein D3C84_553690 [compost metagenome]
MAHQNLAGMRRGALQVVEAGRHGARGLGDFADHVLQVSDERVDRVANGAQLVFGTNGDAFGQVGVTGGQCVDIGLQGFHALDQLADRIDLQQHQQDHHRDLQQAQCAEHIVALRGDQLGRQGGGEEPRRAFDRAHEEGAGFAFVVELDALRLITVLQAGLHLAGER